MRLHTFQHVPFEDLASIADWAREKHHTVTRTRLYAEDPLPAPDAFDALVVLGGPMNVDEEKKFPWLREEKKGLEHAIRAGKAVLGICLGAQLIARVLGARVRTNTHKEIGWYPVALTPEASGTALFTSWPSHFMAFHWHGDTFDIPSGAARIAESEGCLNQGFSHEGKLIGLQFHLESSLASVERLIENSSDDLKAGKYVQSAQAMTSQAHHIPKMQQRMRLLLDAWASPIPEPGLHSPKKDG